MSIQRYYPYALGFVGLVAAGGAVHYWRTRRGRELGEAPSPTDDPDPDTAPDQSYPLPEEPLSELILDRRAEGVDAMQRYMAQTGKRPSKGPGSRDASNVDSLVLHQTGFTRGNEPEKYFKVTAHFVITPDGKIIWIHPFDEYLQASNTLNSRSVAVEFVGNFPANNGECWNPEKFGCHTPSEAQLEAGRYLVKWLVDVQPGFQAVFSHRQSAASRGNDPGPMIWREVGEYAIHELGLVDIRDETYGKGRPIPAAWRTDASRSLGQDEELGPTPTPHQEDLALDDLLLTTTRNL